MLRTSLAAVRALLVPDVSAPNPSRRTLLGRGLLLFVAANTAQKAAAAEPDAASQPASQPTTAGARRPAQAEILRNLLSEQAERPKPVLPTDSGRQGGDAAGSARGLLTEGTIVVERPGRLVREDGRAKFLLHVEGEGPAPRAMPVLESQLLELMEREAEAGFAEFIVSAEVTRYRGTNYLLMRKVLRRTSHNNVAP